MTKVRKPVEDFATAFVAGQTTRRSADHAPDVQTGTSQDAEDIRPTGATVATVPDGPP